MLQRRIPPYCFTTGVLEIGSKLDKERVNKGMDTHSEPFVLTIKTVL